MTLTRILTTLICLFCHAMANAEVEIIQYGDTPLQQVQWHAAHQQPASRSILFVDSRQWTSSLEASNLPEPTIRYWNEHGTNVAVIKHRNQYNAFAELADDLHAAVGRLNRDGKLDSEVYLAGQETGAHIILTTLMHKQYKSALNAELLNLKGVIAISGVYNLTPGYPLYEGQVQRYESVFGSTDDRTEHSPVHLVNTELKIPVLLINAEEDISNYSVDARQFVTTLREHDVDAMHHIIPGRDHSSLMYLGAQKNPARTLVSTFTGIEQASDNFKLLLDIEKRWDMPPVTTKDFWQHENLIREYPMEAGVRKMVNRLYVDNQFRLSAWRMEHYYAIPLQDWLQHQFPGHSENYLITTNTRNEKYYWDLEEIKQYDPVIVVGLDNEKNLFRLTIFYQAKRQYSWQEENEPLPVMARSLGAFLYFRKPVPEHLQPRFQAQFSLTSESFKLVKNNPLARFNQLDKELYKVITYKNGCVACHSISGFGSRAQNNTALTYAPYGGFALPLESYAPHVWKKFVYQQEAVAKVIGTAPNPLPENIQDRIYEWVNAARNNQ